MGDPLLTDAMDFVIEGVANPRSCKRIRGAAKMAIRRLLREGTTPRERERNPNLERAIKWSADHAAGGIEHVCREMSPQGRLIFVTAGSVAAGAAVYAKVRRQDVEESVWDQLNRMVEPKVGFDMGDLDPRFRGIEGAIKIENGIAALRGAGDPVFKIDGSFPLGASGVEMTGRSRFGDGKERYSVGLRGEIGVFDFGVERQFGDDDDTSAYIRLDVRRLREALR